MDRGASSSAAAHSFESVSRGSAERGRAGSGSMCRLFVGLGGGATGEEQQQQLQRLFGQCVHKLCGLCFRAAPRSGSVIAPVQLDSL
jgi:hypothetical protein